MEKIKFMKKNMQFEILRESDRLFLSVGGGKSGRVAAEKYNNIWGYRVQKHELNRILKQSSILLSHESAREMADSIEKIRQQTEQNEKRKYNFLIEKLPAIPDFSNTPDQQKFQEIISRKQSYCSGAEMDGINLAISAANDRLYQEAQKYCHHQITTDIYRTHTGDARRKIERTIECTKCGLRLFDCVSEKLSENALWN